MPSNVDNVAINNPKYDKRVKLTDEDREAIKEEYVKGGTSYNKLAAQYGVSKRLVYFIVNPEKHEEAKKQYRERSKDGRYYDQKAHNESMKRHRKYKKELYEKGVLKIETEEKRVSNDYF